MRHKSINLLAITLCFWGGVFYCYEYCLRVTPSIIKPQLMHAYNLNETGISLLIALYYFAYVPLQFLVGIIFDHYGPRQVLTMACLCCALGTYLFAGTSITLIAAGGRFLVGFGSAFAYVGVLKIANIWLPKKYFALTAGICTALGMLGAISGDVLMLRIVEAIGWKQALYWSAFGGFVLAAIIWWSFTAAPQKNHLIAFSKHHTKIYRELGQILSNKQLWINGLIGNLMFLPLTVFAEVGAPSFLHAIGLTTQQAALGTALVFLGFACGSPVWGHVSDVIKSRKLLLYRCAYLAAGISGWLIWLPPSHINLLLVILFTIGFFASAQILVFAVGNDICHPHLSSTTAAFTNFVIMLGGTLPPVLVGKVIDLQTPLHLTEHITHSLNSYQTALSIFPLGLLAAGFLAHYLLHESYQEH